MNNTNPPAERISINAEKVRILKSTAVNQAMVEVIQENRAEIIRRASVKLKSLGIEVSEDELGQP